MRIERTRRVGRLGRLTVCRAAIPIRGFLLNRYPGKVIGIAFGWGRQPYLSYISPLTLIYDPLAEEMHRENLFPDPDREADRG